MTPGDVTAWTVAVSGVIGLIAQVRSLTKKVNATVEKHEELQQEVTELKEGNGNG